MSFRCIKLSAKWEPMEIVPWIDAFELAYIHDRADVLWSYPEEYRIRSQYHSWEYASIIVLKNHHNRRPEKRNISPSLRAILIRDLYTCQYCLSKLTNSNGTRDHVIPESKGGKLTWNNLVAACRTCQDKKADRMPEECGMYPKKMPKAPMLSEKFTNEVRRSSSFERTCWKAGLKKLGLDYVLKDTSNAD